MWFDVPEVVMAEGGAVRGLIPFEDMSCALMGEETLYLGWMMLAGLGDSISCRFPIAAA